MRQIPPVLLVALFLVVSSDCALAQNDKFHIDKMEPSEGAPGITAMIIGENFGKLEEAGRHVIFSHMVEEGPKKADILSWSNTEIVIKVPILDRILFDKKSVDVKVGGIDSTLPWWRRNQTVYSNSVKFTYVEPVIFNIFPRCGPEGTEVAIRGKHFGFPPKLGRGGYSVRFLNSPVMPEEWTEERITVKTPDDYGLGLNAAKFARNLLLLGKSALTDTIVQEAAAQVADDLLPPLKTLELKESDSWWESFDKIFKALWPFSGIKLVPGELSDEGYFYVPVLVKTPVGEAWGEFCYHLKRIIKEEKPTPRSSGESFALKPMPNVAAGFARDQHGKPVEGATVWLVDFYREWRNVRSAETASNGYFKIDISSLFDGTYHLFIIRGEDHNHWYTLKRRDLYDPYRKDVAITKEAKSVGIVLDNIVLRKRYRIKALIVGPTELRWHKEGWTYSVYKSNDHTPETQGKTKDEQLLTIPLSEGTYRLVIWKSPLGGKLAERTVVISGNDVNLGKIVITAKR